MHPVHIHLQAFCDFSLVFKGNTKRAVDTYRREISSFLNHEQIQDVGEINLTSIQGYMMAGKLEKNWSNNTVRNRIIALRIFGDWCIEQGLMTTSPARQISLPKLPKKLPRSLSKSDAQKVLEWTQHYGYEFKFERSRAVAIIAIFMFSGVRLQEIRNLKMQDVRLTEQEVYVRCGKGARDRLIPMNLELAMLLQPYLAERQKLKRRHPAFFVALRHDRQMGEKAIPRLVKKLREASGIYFTPHMLRHTFATLMLEGGADIYAISKMMGHSDIKTTTLYLSASTKHLKHEIAKHSLNHKNRRSQRRSATLGEFDF